MISDLPTDELREDFRERTLASEEVYSGLVLTVLRDRVRLPDGREGVREHIRHPGAALVVPQLDDGRVVMVLQFRYALGRAIWEFPAGRRDPGESALASAQRELLEETGYAAASWRSLGGTDLCVGYSNERIEFFLAQGLQQQGARPDAEEFFEVAAWDLAAIERAIQANQLTDAKVMAAWLLARPLLMENLNQA